jgi:NAD(P)-dependent dehydrogenase (short-subunit alcohol dehydrogenase family)
MGRARAVALAREGCDLTPRVKPEDVSAAVLFLLSDEARFISGETLSVDAGDSAH